MVIKVEFAYQKNIMRSDYCLNMFRRQLKTYFLRNIDEYTQRIRDFFDNALHKFTLYLLTYLLTAEQPSLLA